MSKKGRAIPDHKKHQVFPGYKPSSDVIIQAATIKPIRKPPEPILVSAKNPAQGSEWDAYEAALIEVRNSTKNASSAALQIRKGYEERYYQAARSMMRTGKLMRIKKKYQ